MLKQWGAEPTWNQDDLPPKLALTFSPLCPTSTSPKQGSTPNRVTFENYQSSNIIHSFLPSTNSTPANPKGETAGDCHTFNLMIDHFLHLFFDIFAYRKKIFLNNVLKITLDFVVPKKICIRQVRTASWCPGPVYAPEVFIHCFPSGDNNLL